MSVLSIDTAEVFEPLLYPSRYKGAHGGRSSGKSHFFAEMAVERCIMQPGTRILCGRQVQKSLKESAMQLIKDKIEKLGAKGFDVQSTQIITPGGGLIVFQGLAEHTADSIKSYEGFHVFWIEEAHTISEHSLSIIRPTLRAEDSELWFSWNPRRKSDPVDKLLRGPFAKELGAVVVEANWRDNPWLPKVMADERVYDEAHSPDTYQHIWEGQYATIHKGAYFASALADAQREGRVSHVARDPNMQIRTFWDLGRRDATAIWVAQFIGKSINVIDYLEGEGQPPSYYFQELRARGYSGCMVTLPHDGARIGPDNAISLSYEDQAKQAGFDTQTVTNQGVGAAMLRVNAARRLFPQMWFNAKPTEPGREALGAYHEKRDDKREIGLGPDHDWSSHAADAFGLMCIAYEEPKLKRDAQPERRVYTVGNEEAGSAWMGS